MPVTSILSPADLGRVTSVLYELKVIKLNAYRKFESALPISIIFPPIEFSICIQISDLSRDDVTFKLQFYGF